MLVPDQEMTFLKKLNLCITTKEKIRLDIQLLLHNGTIPEAALAERRKSFSSGRIMIQKEIQAAGFKVVEFDPAGLTISDNELVYFDLD